MLHGFARRANLHESQDRAACTPDIRRVAQLGSDGEVERGPAAERHQLKGPIASRAHPVVVCQRVVVVVRMREDRLSVVA